MREMEKRVRIAEMAAGFLTQVVRTLTEESRDRYVAEAVTLAHAVMQHVEATWPYPEAPRAPAEVPAP